jgi:predicted amidohydrolase
MSSITIVAVAQSSSAAGDIETNVARHVDFVRIAADSSVQLLVFPELSLTGYELDIAKTHVIAPEDKRLDPLRRIAAESQMTIVAGAPILNAQLHIGAFIFHPDGSVSTYTKQHVHESEQHVFTSGPGGPPIRVAEATVALGICADASHPEHAASAASSGADIYAVGVMITEEEYARKAGLMAKYAAVHGMIVMMANYSGTTGGWKSGGKSAIWGTDGTLLAMSTGTDEEIVLSSGGRKQYSGAEST